MPKMTLKTEVVKRFAKFISDHDGARFFVAKDQGAYVGVGATVNGKVTNDLQYFKGCNPDTDEDWYDEASYKFGGDDFGEMLDSSILKRCAADPRFDKLVLNVTKTAISIEGYNKAI